MNRKKRKRRNSLTKISTACEKVLTVHNYFHYFIALILPKTKFLALISVKRETV